MKINRIREPFDQYSRQYYIQTLINKVVRQGEETLSIIDLGGHRGNTSQLFPTDKVTVLDVFDEQYEGYVKGDATDTNFTDKLFDVSTSFDVFEHIPRSKRKKFIEESVRIAKIGTFLAAPFDDSQNLVSGAEKAANSLFRKVNHKEHPWLKEHIEYGIPTHEEIEATIEDVGYFYCRLSTNPVDNWLLMQSLIFASTALKRDVKQVVDTNQFYNSHLESLEDPSLPSYRSIYFITRDRQLAKKIESSITKTFETTKRNPKVQALLIEKASNAVVSMLQELVEDRKYLLAKVNDLEEANQALAKEGLACAREIRSLQDSPSWKLTKPLRVLQRLTRK